MNRVHALLILLVIITVSTFSGANPLSISQLKSRVKYCADNLHILDYNQIYANIEQLTDLQSRLLEGSETENQENQALFDRLLKQTYLLSYESLTNETRAIWIDNVYMGNISEKADVKEMMQWLHAMNFNVIVPDVFNNGKAIYPSKVAPQFDRYELLYKGDVLQDMIEEAHKLGMEVHPLVVLFGLDTGWEQFIDNLILFDQDIEGKFINMYGQAFLSPAVPENRERLISVIKEVAGYDIDGLNLDYVRFSTGFGYGTYISDIWRAFNGTSPHKIGPFSPHLKEYEEFKALFISTFVDRAMREISAINPEIIVSADVQAPYTWGKHDLFQDHKHWTDNRYLHSLMLMSYNYTAEEFLTHIGNDAKHINNRAFTLPGMGLYNFDEYEYLRQIEASRKLPFAGQVSFSAIHLVQDKEEFLKEGPYREPASITLRSPQDSAATILFDLASRLELTAEQSKIDSETLQSWQNLLKDAAASIAALDLRPWPNRNLKEEDPAERELLEAELLKLRALVRDARNLKQGTERTILEIERSISILEMLKHMASPYIYSPVQY